MHSRQQSAMIIVDNPQPFVQGHELLGYTGLRGRYNDRHQATDKIGQNKQDHAASHCGQGRLSARATTTVRRLSAHIPQAFLLFFNCNVTPLCLAKYCFMRAVCLPDTFAFCRHDAQWGGGATVGYKLQQGGADCGLQIEARGANGGLQTAIRPDLIVLTYEVVRTSRPVLFNITRQPPVIQVWDIIP